jgi:manganese transport protein
MLTADKRKMGALTAPRWLTAVAAVVALIIITLNIKVVYDAIAG